MPIDSFPYVFSLLGLSFIYYFLNSARAQNYYLLILSLSFYIYLTHFWSLILIFTLVLTALAIKYRHKKLIYFSIGMILGQFLYLKQFVPDHSIISSENFLFPIGISFFTFQAVSLIIDYKDSNEKLRVSDVLLFLSFFPQLTAGPIEKGNELIPQFQQKRNFSPSLLEESLIKIGCGFLKKFLVANVIAEALMNIKTAPAISLMELCLLPILCRYFIYSNFSSYTDIALGSSRLFGIKLIENFDRPLHSRNLTEFWQRWHISLGRWVKSYIYFPLAINLLRKKLPVVIATFISFILIGLWHGLTVPFFIYGTIQALFIFLESKFPAIRFEKGDGLGKRFILGNIYRYLIFMAPSVLFFFNQTDLARLDLNAHSQAILPLLWAALVITLWEVLESFTKKWHRNIPLFIQQAPYALRLLIYLMAFTMFTLWGNHQSKGSFLYFYF